MGLDQYAKLKGQKLNFDKIFSDDSNPKEDGFVWRKHARLQVFMNKQWIKQNEHKYKKQLPAIYIYMYIYIYVYIC